MAIYTRKGAHTKIDGVPSQEVLGIRLGARASDYCAENDVSPTGALILAGIEIAWLDAESSKDRAGNYQPASETIGPVRDPGRVKPTVNRHQLETAADWLAGHKTVVGTIRQSDLEAIRGSEAEALVDAGLIQEALRNSISDLGGGDTA